MNERFNTLKVIPDLNNDNILIADTRITPGLIPHQQFHKGSWMLSVKRPSWYYYMESEKQHPITDEHFLESVDPPLKELISFLHHLGIETTASCAGHHKSEKEFEKIYDALEKDKGEITTGGLKLKDIESGKIYLYRNKNYHLPWSRKKFLDKVIRYQENGIIGIKPFGEVKERMLHIHIPRVKIRERDSIVFIETSEHSLRKIWNKWRKITREVKNIF